jgi:L-seryl-tRNA(Ser) seleniumtransferase
VARRYPAPLVVDLGLGGLTTTAAIAGLEGVMSAAEAIRAGVDICFIRGDKLLGGPACGIAVGNARLIERMEAHPLRAAWRLDRLSRIGLVATLEAAIEAARESTENGGQEFDADPPAVRLLRASLENLRNRAERLAPQLAATPIIGSAEARVSQAPLATVHDGWVIPSWSVFVQPRSGTAVALLQKLANATPALLGQLAGDQVELNLRSVPPSQDVDLVEAIEQLGP